MSGVPDYALSTTIYIQFTTRAFATGVPAQLAGTPAISVLEENNATAITAGITLNVDRATVTGLNEVAIVASGANGYEAGKEYAAYISTGTVGGTSVVGEVVGRFSIEKQSALRPTTAGRTLDVSATGEAGLDWANIGSPTTAQNLSATNIDVDQIVASVSGAVGSVTGAVGSVAAGGIAAASFAAGAIDAAAIAANAIGASELAADAATEIADAVLSRNVSNVEATAGEHTLCTVILGTLEYAVSGSTWTIKRTDGTTTHATKTLTTNAAAEQVTAVA